MVFIDQYSGLSYVHLQKTLLEAERIEAKKLSNDMPALMEYKLHNIMSTMEGLLTTSGEKHMLTINKLSLSVASMYISKMD